MTTRTKPVYRDHADFQQSMQAAAWAPYEKQSQEIARDFGKRIVPERQVGHAPRWYRMLIAEEKAVEEMLKRIPLNQPISRKSAIGRLNSIRAQLADETLTISRDEIERDLDELLGDDHYDPLIGLGRRAVVGAICLVVFVVAFWLCAVACGGERDTLRAHLPTVNDPAVTEAFNDPATLWYTDEEMPPAYQHDTDISGYATFHNPEYDLSGGADEKQNNGNGNREFPWQHPGGSDRSQVRTLRALVLPVVDGQRLPVVAYPETVMVIPGPTRQKHKLGWRFPRGARLFEVLFLNDPAGKPWAFEVRSRTRREQSWDTSLFRPVPTREDLVEEFIFDPQPVIVKQFVARHPRMVAFQGTAGWEPLPLLAPEDVQRLLSRPFEEVTGVNWSEQAAAPTSVQAFSIVPKDYDGTLAGNDPVSCARCHEHVARSVADFDPARDWYGFIRGSDGIFSFLPVHPSSISRAGERRPVRLHPDLVRAGYVQSVSGPPNQAPYLPLEAVE